MKSVKNNTPTTAVSIDTLNMLCEKYHDEICRGVKPNYLPKIRLRYVEDQGKFGYAEFGDFILIADDLFVWRQESKFANDDNEDLKSLEFNDKCVRPGYMCRFLYAGVDTNVVDCNGEHIFEGDVLEITKCNNVECQFALSCIKDGSDTEIYGFLLDNHFLSLDECLQNSDIKLRRIGTAFFRLDWNLYTEGMLDIIRNFNGWRDTTEEHEEKVFKAQYTPNFDQESWKYHAFEALEIEFDWR